MSKRKPTISQPGIDRYFCKSRRTESQEDEGEKTAGDGDRQTPAIPTKSNSTARVDEGEKTADNSDRQTPAIPTMSNSAARVDEDEKQPITSIGKHQRCPLRVIQQHVLMKVTKHPIAQASILCCHRYSAKR